jgi:hypothetical protein
MVTNDKTGRATSQITVTIRLYPLPVKALAEGRIKLQKKLPELPDTSTHVAHLHTISSVENGINISVNIMARRFMFAEIMRYFDRHKTHSLLSSLNPKRWLAQRIWIAASIDSADRESICVVSKIARRQGDGECRD